MIHRFLPLEPVGVRLCLLHCLRIAFHLLDHCSDNFLIPYKVGPLAVVHVIILVFCEVHVVFSSSSLSGLDSLNGCEGFSELCQLASWLHGRCLCSLAFACLWSGWVGKSLSL